MRNQISMTAKAQRSHIVRLVQSASMMFILLGVIVLVSPGLSYGQAKAPASLPDWSGIWSMQGGTTFDRASVKDGVEHPPLTPAWQKIYDDNHAKVTKGQFSDPLTRCGIPAGFPRLLQVPDPYEFVVTAKQTWILTENGPNTMRIYTDGVTKLPAPEDRWPTYTGWSVGHWEGEGENATLVFETVGLKGWIDHDTILDRTGLVLSDAMDITTRIHRIDATTLEATMVLTDAKALTKPWTVSKQYKRSPEGQHIMDYACGENNRNPIDEEGVTRTKGPDGKLL